LCNENFAPPRPEGATQVNLVVLAFFSIAAFFLQTEHRAHLFGALPFLLLLACPLLHSLVLRRFHCDFPSA
jgi:hypothetical protein